MKKIAVFCDGTWNKSDQKTHQGKPCPTNVVRLLEATTPSQDQIVHYVRGVGTEWGERLAGGGFGFGISDNIKEAYRFIVNNYCPGDQIYLFGFSRGAFTARSVAGFIHNLGILKREHLQQSGDAYTHYKDRENPDWSPSGSHAIAWRKRYTWSGPEDEPARRHVHCLGVWDTVGALGAPFGGPMGWIVEKIFACHFHDHRVSRSVQSAFHALAIDERRWPFRPTLMEFGPERREEQQRFQQAWFPGVHSNVGGGYPDTGLSDAALQWMAARAQERGLLLDLAILNEPPFKPDPQGRLENSQSFLIRAVTLLAVKWPSMAGLHWPYEDQSDIQRIRWWNGDYLREVNAACLSQEAQIRLQGNVGYQPENCP